MLQPDIPSALGLLTHLNVDELKEMLNDDTKFDSILKDVKQVKDWEIEKEMMIASNRSLAEFNLGREPEIESLKVQVQEKSEVGEQLCNRLQELLTQYKSKAAGISPDTTLALLQASAAETEETSENLAQDFLSGKIDADQFLLAFEPVRKTMHLRKFKVEKMVDMIRNAGHGNNGFGSSLPYPNIGARSGLPSMPYPMGPVNMPMPGMFGNHF